MLHVIRVDDDAQQRPRDENAKHAEGNSNGYPRAERNRETSVLRGRRDGQHRQVGKEKRGNVITAPAALGQRTREKTTLDISVILYLLIFVVCASRERCLPPARPPSNFV